MVRLQQIMRAWHLLLSISQSIALLYRFYSGELPTFVHIQPLVCIFVQIHSFLAAKTFFNSVVVSEDHVRVISGQLHLSERRFSYCGKIIRNQWAVVPMKGNLSATAHNDIYSIYIFSMLRDFIVHVQVARTDADSM